ncbi:hypothetical protein Hdeb2414_s0021g00577331 [Helianthus debilis subsp. tardiflorus]
MHQKDSRSNSISISHVPASPSGLNSTSPTSITQAPSSLVQFAEVESQVDGNSIDHGSLFERVVDRSSDSQSRSLSHMAAVIAIISGSEEQSSGQGRLMSIRANWAISDIVQWKLGSEPMMGHDVGLTSVVDLDYTDLGPCVGQKMIVGLIFSILKLHETGKAPFDRGNASLSHRLFNGMRLTFWATWHLWVVHGQPRPPEDSSEEVFTGIPGHASEQSLEDKTFLKGGIDRNLIEIAYLIV